MLTKCFSSWHTYFRSCINDLKGYIIYVSHFFLDFQKSKNRNISFWYYRCMIIFDTLGVSETIFGQPRIRKTYPECPQTNMSGLTTSNIVFKVHRVLQKSAKFMKNIIKNTQNIKNHQKSSKMMKDRHF